MSIAPRGEAPRSLLVVRLGAMGDVIHTMYAVAALHAALPETKTGWAIEERWAELVCAKGADSGEQGRGRPLIDLIHLVNTKRWRRSPLSAETTRQVKNAFAGMRAQKYAVAADFQGAIKSALVARFAGADEVAGMAAPREAPAKLFYKRRVTTSGTHVIEQYCSLAEAMAGQRLQVIAPEFPRDDQAEASITKKFGESQIVILNPGAGWAAKQWPAERYGEVARALAREGMKPVINFGPGEEELARAAEATSDGTAAAISCSVSDLIALTRRARLLVGGDTGPLHLAAAMKVPVVALFGPTDPARNGPYGTRSVVLRNSASKMSLSHTRDADPGLLQITTEDVVRAAWQLLEVANG
ncbi:MAG TPA: glycosyltransferase family 9 protein [Terriglobales bacterium]